MKIELTLPRAPSQNALQKMREGVSKTGRRFGHRQYAQHRDKMCWLIRQHLVEAGAGPRWARVSPGQRRSIGLFGAPPSRTTVSVVRYSPGELDYANMVGGLKPYIDALVIEGLVYDDSNRWMTATYEQRKCKRGESRTEIEITW